MENAPNIILTGTPSDSHTWNLIFMELFLKENQCQVRNLGACIPVQELLQAIKASSPDLVVISSVNGHLFQDAIKVISFLANSLSHSLPLMVAGGRLGISRQESHFGQEKLIKLGYEGIFVGAGSLLRFQSFLSGLKKSLAKNAICRPNPPSMLSDKVYAGKTQLYEAQNTIKHAV